MKHPHEQIYINEIANVRRNYMMKAVDKDWMPAKVKELEEHLRKIRREDHDA